MRRVDLTERAIAQLQELESHIADEGSPITAARYVDAIVDYCESLQIFPHRGTRRDDLLPGLRMVGYKHRVTIAFEVTDDAVNILGIYYGGQDITADFKPDE